MKRYHNYHKHTYYSNLRTLDTVTSPEAYMERAKELGHTTYFCGEHGYQGNLFETQALCEKYELKPIYSVEAYYVDDIEDKNNRKAYHIMLIGLTQKARYEINKIMSIANTTGFYYKPRIGMKELLSLTPTDTVVTTACVASRLSDLLEYDDKGNFIDFANVKKQQEVINNFLLPLKNHFGDNLFLEVQNHKASVQVNYNKVILTLHKEFNIPLIHANDSHYIHEGDSYYRDLFLKAKGIVYEEERGFVLDYPDYDTVLERYELQGVLSREQAIQALDNTLIFDKAEAVFTDKEFKIPKVPNEFIHKELNNKYSNNDSNKVLKEIINRAWAKKKPTIKKEKQQEYIDAIRYEMKIIEKCGMADYFVLNHMITNRAIKEYDAVLTRSGRGSAVSFLINNLIGLTEVDRMKAPTKLYPTRFMSAERILSSRSLPDIDKNWANVEPVIKASKDILGEDGIYYMVAYKPLQRSSAFRLWCKARDYDINEYDDVAKLLGEKDYTDEQFKEDNPKWAIELENSKNFRGVIESVAPSPCSFLLSNNPISEEIGLIKVGDVICCALDGYNCDLYKFLKNDELTVKVYEIIDRVYSLIGRPIDDISTLVNNCDDKVWDIYEKGLTTTINQADSDLGKQLIMRYKPRNLAEISAWVAAIRPGFASLLNTFLDRQPYTTGVEALDEILKDTSHFMIYQESIMSYLVWLGIEEKGTYDIIKKIAKKKFKEEELRELKDKLIDGWIKNVGTQDGFEDTWQVVEDAARYSFNASHALSVAIDSLYGAYLKSHYPLEYFTVVLTMYSDDQDRTNNLINELKHFDIKINDIRFRKSKADYSMEKSTNSIYKGISSIKFCNSQIADELYELRDNQYETFIDLLMDIQNTSVNSRQLEILIKLNFFEEFGHPNKLLTQVELFNNLYGKKQFKKDKLNELKCDAELVKKYSEKETEKMFTKVDTLGLLKELVMTYEYPLTTIYDYLIYENECLGYITYSNSEVDKHLFYVTELDVKKTIINIKLHEINTGKQRDVRMWARAYNSDPFKQNDILLITSIKKENKKEPTGEINPDTGKKIYKAVPDKYEYWLQKYIVKDGADL